MYINRKNICRVHDIKSTNLYNNDKQQNETFVGKMYQPSTDLTLDGIFSYNLAKFNSVIL